MNASLNLKKVTALSGMRNIEVLEIPKFMYNKYFGYSISID
jgi:hypothetical protein